LSLACPQCNAEMPNISSFCPACGADVTNSKPGTGKTGGISDNIAGALAYITIIPAIIFLLVEPLKRNRFIRFHAFQCIFLVVAGLLLGIVLRLGFTILLLIPVLGQLLVLLISMILSIGCLILWIVLIVKALQGELFKVPFIGDLAEKQANLM
jgi:uncharacterized membrane protein